MDDLEYDQEDEFNASYSDDLEDDREIEQDMVWHVIDKYFHTKGLVGQQIDSFDEFISLVLQELVDDAGEIKITPEDQFIPDQEVQAVSFLFSVSISISFPSKSRSIGL
jgi:DNA-directed RNA polymerase beta subunit